MDVASTKISAQLMNRFNYSEANKRRRNIVEKFCDPAIAQAVVVCLDLFKPSDSLTIGVRARSVPAKIAKYLHPVLCEYARRIEVPLTSGSGISKLVPDMVLMDGNIQTWGRQVIAQANRQGQKQSREACHTIDTLRNFFYFCRAFRTRRFPIQFAELNKVGKYLYSETEKRPGPLKGAYTEPLETYFDAEGWCHLCCRTSQTEQLKRERISAGDYVNPGLPLAMKEKSAQYCADHSPYRSASTGQYYKTDLKRRAHWHAVMRALIEVRRLLKLNALDFEQLRRQTWDLVFLPKIVLPSVQAIYDYVQKAAAWRDEAEMRQHLQNLLGQALLEISAASLNPGRSGYD
jgi:hypothetical protein